jgi:hypothetical protein
VDLPSLGQGLLSRGSWPRSPQQKPGNESGRDCDGGAGGGRDLETLRERLASSVEQRLAELAG